MRTCLLVYLKEGLPVYGKKNKDKKQIPLPITNLKPNTCTLLNNSPSYSKVEHLRPHYKMLTLPFMSYFSIRISVIMQLAFLSLLSF